MRKTVLAPEHGELPDDTDPVMSLGTVVHHDDHRAVTLSGAIWPRGDLEAQTRSVLSYVEEVLCDDLDGSLADVTHLRFHVREDVLTPEHRTAIHEVRREFFEPPDLPASTMVGVAGLVDDEALVEVETEAVLPDDGWEVETVEPE